MKRIFLFAVALWAAVVMYAVPRAEYPRPQFERKDWVNLNGDWTYAFDFVGSGMEKKFHESRGFDGHITVPFCPESKLSGVGYTDFIRHIWYQRPLSMPQAWAGKNIMLHFGAVYYTSEIFIDGKLAGRHFGGSTSFALDITKFVADGKEHSLVVHAYSDPRTTLQPAGKQNLRLVQFECMYTRCTGIWQTVWMEPVAPEALTRVQVTTDIDQNCVCVQPYFEHPSAARFVVTLRDGKKVIARQTAPAQNGTVLTLPVGRKPHLWWPEDPYLYQLTYEVLNEAGQVIDEVQSYTGLRKIHTSGNKVYLNNEPYYQRLVLDQGFYPDGIWTAPSDEALRHDIELSKAAGFNGARLHQKVFEERFHYWADHLGYLTWGEAPSWGMDTNNPEVARNFLNEWREEILRDRNHPSIVVWTPMNEEWWPDHEQYARFVCDVYDLTKSLDSRPVCDVSGGVHVKTDIWTEHTYEQDPAKLKDKVYNGERWFVRTPKPIDVPQRNVGFNRLTDTQLYEYPTYDAPTIPYILDEFGGIKWVKGQDKETGNSQQSWGYGEPPHSLEEFYTRLEGQVDALLSLSENVWGYCYTQLTDVEQEQNGVYFYDRSSKFDMNRIRAIFSKKPAGAK